MTILVSDQAAYTLITEPGMVVADQAAYAMIRQPGMVVADQAAYVLMLPQVGGRDWYLANGPLSTTAMPRFDARYWTVNFPRPMMGAVTAEGSDAFEVTAAFYNQNDLLGVIWASADTIDHPLAAYTTNRDYRGLTLSFEWASDGVMVLDANNGPSLTVTGFDASGSPQVWYIRLWNYAVGTNTNATITLPFDNLIPGFSIVGGTPIFTGNITSMFISLVAPGYTGDAVPLASPVNATVNVSGISCTGTNNTLEVGTGSVPAHNLRLSTGFDDSYNITPIRMLQTAYLLGYRELIDHYLGMSHYFDVENSGGEWLVSLDRSALNVAAAAWHRSFASIASSLGYAIVLAVSYEILDQNCWPDWKQLDYTGAPAQTGYTPPSTLVSPANTTPMSYIHTIALAVLGILVAAGQAPQFQAGEPWWWTQANGAICLYDSAAQAAFGGSPVVIENVISTSLSTPQKSLLDQAGVLLAASTAALIAAIKAVYPATRTYVLSYLPTVLNPAAPDLRRANVPLGWASPAFDVLQLEDYEWVTGGETALTLSGWDTITARLGYPRSQQEYFAGFVTDPSLAATQWPLIDAAVAAARNAFFPQVYLWALPEVMRDGFVYVPHVGRRRQSSFM